MFVCFILVSSVINLIYLKQLVFIIHRRYSRQWCNSYIRPILADIFVSSIGWKKGLRTSCKIWYKDAFESLRQLKETKINSPFSSYIIETNLVTE